MTNIYFIRHAESTWNAYGDLSKNVPITKTGEIQASQISGYVDIVICSTLQRARQTLTHSKLGYKQVIYTDLCREIKNGTAGDYFDIEDPTEHESDDQIDQRIIQLKSLISDLKVGTIGIISHYCFIRKITGISINNCQCLKYNEW